MSAPGTVLTGIGGSPLGYQQISAVTLAAATGLTVPAGATVAYVSVDTAPVRWRDDGTAPTSAIGMQIPTGGERLFPYSSALTVKFILIAAGSPVLNVSYY